MEGPPYRVSDLVDLVASISPEQFVDWLDADVLMGRLLSGEGRSAWTFQTKPMRRPSEGEELQKADWEWEFRAAVVHPIRAPADREVVLLGRASSNDIQIDDESVSKLHARLYLPGPVLVDAQSANGTLVDEVRLQEGERVPLRPGASVTFGSLQFRFFQRRLLYNMLKRFA